MIGLALKAVDVSKKVLSKDNKEKGKKLLGKIGAFSSKLSDKLGGDKDMEDPSSLPIQDAPEQRGQWVSNREQAELDAEAKKKKNTMYMIIAAVVVVVLFMFKRKK